MLALQKSLDGGQTFEQVRLDVEDYTVNGKICNVFYSVKDSQNNTYVACNYSESQISAGSNVAKSNLLKITNAGVITKYVYSSGENYATIKEMSLSRDENSIFFINYTGQLCVFDGSTFNNLTIDTAKFAIYQDRYIWVASGLATVSIYDYTTKALLATKNTEGMNVAPNYIALISCDTDGGLIVAGQHIWSTSTGTLAKYVYTPPVNPDTTGTLTIVGISTSTYFYQNYNILKQLLIDRFGDLIIITNTGTASTLLKYSNTGTLIDTVSLSVAGILGVGRGAYGLQVYSHKDANGIVTDCYCYFSNDMGTWKTAPTVWDADPLNRKFGAITKIRNNGETTYGDDWGGDNNYSVRC